MNYLRFLQDADTERQEDEARRYDKTQDELDAIEEARFEGAPVAGEQAEQDALFRAIYGGDL